MEPLLLDNHGTTDHLPDNLARLADDLHILQPLQDDGEVERDDGKQVH
jgi:hypothetical protein